jgi:two-component system phosphate regulon sensor histidine kinase PhoR
LRRLQLVWQIFLPLGAVLVLSLAAVAWYATQALEAFYYQQTAADLEARAVFAEAVLREHLAGPDRGGLQHLATTIGRGSSTRVTYIAPDGVVMADSQQDPAGMDNHGRRPEVLAALEVGRGSSLRFSDTLHERMMYFAHVARGREDSGRSVLAIVRVAVPVTAIEQALGAVYLRVVLGGVVIASLAVVLALAVSRRLSRPLEELRAAAERFAAGDLQMRIPIPGNDEIGRVARSMNHMAAELDDYIRAISSERNEREAVLSSMVEGVLAVDRGQHVIALNRAGARLLGLDAAQAVGRSIQAAVRNTRLQAFVAEALASEEPLESDIEFRGTSPRFVQAHGAPVRGADGSRIGAVVVLHDVTALRRLEAVRSDFVANVSHELKTPITSIKGFLETLLSGALEDPQTARRFIGIAVRQADRLHAIIEDLLTLSSLEQGDGERSMSVQSCRVTDVVAGAVEICASEAAGKNVAIEVECDPALEAVLNPALVEQALVNLIDNAVKYSGEGGRVVVRSTPREAGGLVVEVCDSGVGIDARHLERLFERFYRVDKARSRKLGGTGLGLAIVKHIAQAHGGTVSVTSVPGQGSTFRLELPSRREAPEA